MTRSYPSVEAQSTPLRGIAAGVGTWVGVLTGIVTSAATWGVITNQTGNAIIGLLGLIPGVLSGILTLIATAAVVVKGEPLVTPVASPRDNAGRVLTPS